MKYADKNIMGSNPNKVVTPKMNILLHKTMVNDFKNRLTRDNSQDHLLAKGMFPSHLYYGGLRMDNPVEECLRYTNNRKHQMVMKSDINKLIISVSSTSIGFIGTILPILSLDICKLYTGQEGVNGNGNQDLITNPDWIHGKVFNVFTRTPSDYRKFSGYAIGGWFTDNETYINDGSLLRNHQYEGLHRDLYQANPEELDPNLNSYFQVISDNDLFSFISNEERVYDGRRMRDLTKEDFSHLNRYLDYFNDNNAKGREYLCTPNPRSNVSTFVIDIAMPYIDNGKVKVKHIVYAYLEDANKFKGMDVRSIFKLHQTEYTAE